MATRIQVVSSQAEDEIPLLSFPQGVPTDISEMELIVRQRGELKKRKREIVGKLDQLNLIGRDHVGGGSSRRIPDACSYAIGVLDPATNVLSVYPAGHAFVMNPVFEEHGSGLAAEASYLDRLRASTEAFGSKKKKKSLKATESNRISSENILGASTLEKALVEKTNDNEEDEPFVANAAEEALEAHRIKMLPKYDVTATTVEGAYPFKDLIQKDHVVALSKYLNSQVLRAEDLPHAKFLEAMRAYTPMKLVTALAGAVHSFHLTESTPSKAAKDAFSRDMAKVLMLHALLALYLQLAQDRHQKVAKNNITLSSKLNYPAPVVKQILYEFTSIKEAGKIAEHFMEKKDK